jgi:LytS/YehU family sensor histidine kinase
MRARFGDDLKVEYAIEPDAAGALVPQLILQPLVENSIRHAESPHVELSIAARQESGSLLLQVRDRGPGLQGTRKGIGLTNTVERLAGLYGANHKFALENGASGGLTVTMRIPYRTSA